MPDALAGKTGLGIHSGLIGDGTLALIEGRHRRQPPQGESIRA